MSHDRPNSGFPDLSSPMPDLQFPHIMGPSPGMVHGPSPGMGHGPSPGMGHGPSPGMGHGPSPGMGHGPSPGLGPPTSWGHNPMPTSMQNSMAPFSGHNSLMNQMHGQMPFDDQPGLHPGNYNGMRPGMIPMGHMSPYGPGMPPRMPGMVPGMNMMGGPPGLSGSGKIYPPNQPMVFNPSNPNAPPIYPCGICHKEVHDNDQAILCESGCNFWFHRICTGLSETAFLMLTKEIYAEWVCDKCLNTKQIPLVKLKP